MSYQLTELEALIDQARHTHNALINPIHFFDQLKAEKSKLTAAFKELGKYEHSTASSEARQSIRQHFNAVMELQNELSGIEEPFFSFLKHVLEDLKLLLTVLYHHILLPKVDKTGEELVGHCDDRQMGQVLEFLVKRGVLEAKGEFTIPAYGIRLVMKRNAETQTIFRPRPRHFIGRLLCRVIGFSKNQ